MAVPSIKKGRFVKVIFQEFKKKVIDNPIVATYLPAGTRMFASYYDRDYQIYCRQLSPTTYRVVFAGGMLREVVGIPDAAIPVTIAKAKYGLVDRALRAFFYHEVAHLRYTDMESEAVIKYPIQEERASLHSLFNIFEDIVIERFCMSREFPYTKKYFKWLESIMFSDENTSKYSDDGSTSMFFNYLLFRMRRGSEFTGTSALFDANEEEMLKHIKTILGEKDAKERLNKVLLFFEYLKTLGLNMNLPDTKGFGGSIAFGKRGKGASPMPSGATENDSESTAGPSKGTGGSSGGGGSGSPSGGGSGPEEEGDDGDIEDNDGEDELDPDRDAPLNEQDMWDSMNSTLHSGEKVHVFYGMEFFRPDDKVSAATDVLLSIVNPMATSIATQIKTFKSRRRPRYVAGKNRGKLHMPSVISGKPINIFKRKEQIGLLPDLAISVLCDNSGSMSGSRADITCRAMLALVSACAKCDVPIEVNAFTEDGHEHCTYRIKTFEDTFAKAKDYFGIVSWDLHSHYETSCTTFAGNEDENNLYEVWREFRKRPWHDKVLIIISDGQTCGSVDDLNNLAKDIQRDGIHVVGIGVESDAVARLYTDHKIFRNMVELEQFPAYLGEVLMRLIKG